MFFGFCFALWAQEIRQDIPTKITSDKGCDKSRPHKEKGTETEYPCGEQRKKNDKLLELLQNG